MDKSTYFLVLLTSCVLATIPANAYDFTLNVYGNANMDDIIDERDIEYVQSIIDGIEDETQFADANYDGQIDGDDILQVELILSGDETNVTIIDAIGRRVTLKIPIERAIATYPGAVTLAANLESADKIVGIDGCSINNADVLLFSQAYPEIVELPNVGMNNDFNQEMIISLEPDVIFAIDWFLDPTMADTIQKNTGIPVVYPGFLKIRFDAQGGYFDTWRQMGIILEKQERAEELISYWEEESEKVADVTSKISWGDKPTVYLAGFGSFSFEGTLCDYNPIDIAGGINLAGELMPTSYYEVVTLSKEQIIDWNPDIILIRRAAKDPHILMEDILSDPTLQTVNAIKNGHVYYVRVGLGGSVPTDELTQCFYLAKLFHPEKFSEVNVETEGNNILEEFYGTKDLYTWMQDCCELHIREK